MRNCDDEMDANIIFNNTISLPKVPNLWKMLLPIHIGVTNYAFQW